MAPLADGFNAIKLSVDNSLDISGRGAVPEE